MLSSSTRMRETLAEGEEVVCGAAQAHVVPKWKFSFFQGRHGWTHPSIGPPRRADYWARAHHNTTLPPGEFQMQCMTQTHVLKRGNFARILADPRPVMLFTSSPDFACPDAAAKWGGEELPRIAHFVRDPWSMAVSSFLYHNQEHTPERFVKRQMGPCPCNERRCVRRTHNSALQYPCVSTHAAERPAATRSITTTLSARELVALRVQVMITCGGVECGGGVAIRSHIFLGKVLSLPEGYLQLICEHHTQMFHKLQQRWFDEHPGLHGQVKATLVEQRRNYDKSKLAELRNAKEKNPLLTPRRALTDMKGSYYDLLQMEPMDGVRMEAARMLSQQSEYMCGNGACALPHG